MKKNRSDITGITHTTLQAQRHHQQCHVVLFFLCVSVERSAFRGTREEERGCFRGGGEEVKTRGIRIYSLYNLSPPQTHLSASFSCRLSSCCSLMFLHWHSSSFMSVTHSPPQSFCLPLTIHHCFSQSLKTKSEPTTSPFLPLYSYGLGDEFLYGYMHYRSPSIFSGSARGQNDVVLDTNITVCWIS